MKAMIATGVGVLALGGLLVANSGRSAVAQPSLAGPALVSQTDANRTTSLLSSSRTSTLRTLPTPNCG